MRHLAPMYAEMSRGSYFLPHPARRSLLRPGEIFAKRRNLPQSSSLSRFTRPAFKRTSPENVVYVQRDAFKPDEVKRIFSQPLFSGCKSPTRLGAGAIVRT